MQDALPEDLAAAWESARAELRASLPSSTFDLWLAPLDAVSARGGTLFVSAPDSVRSWVERRYLPRLEIVLRRLAPGLREVRLLPADHLAITAAAAVERDAAARASQSFDRFVIGPGNRLAHAAALAVAELPGEAYNPLFLHGAPGLGKTHLLGAIAVYLRQQRPDLNVRYTTGEGFTAEFVTALRSKGAESFKERYRGLNVLMIDDVQFLENKPHTEEEFFHTFNALYEGGGQLVLSCDRPPEALSRLAERLRDRFEWGLRVELTPPDLLTRVTLLQHLASVAGGDQPAPDALREIAIRVPANFRRLEGALVRVVALASITGREPTPDLVRSVFEQHPRADSPLSPPGAALAAPSVPDVQEAVCAVLHLSRDELLSPRRTPPIVQARQIAMYLSRDVTDLSLARIARQFNRDHSTVVHAIRRVETKLEPGSDVHQVVEKSRALLGGSNQPGVPSSPEEPVLNTSSPPSKSV